MSDRIAVMQGGRIEQLGTAREIYEAPASAFVAGFIGTTNLIPGLNASRTAPGMLSLDTAAGPAVIATGDRHFDGSALLLMVRPERLKLARPGVAPDGANIWPAQVTQAIYLGGRTEIRLRLRDGATAISYAVNESGTIWNGDEMVDAWFRPEDAWLVPSPDTSTDS